MQEKSDKMLKPEEVATLAAHLRETLQQGVTPKWGILEIPQVLGALYKSWLCDDADMRVLELESTMEAFVGQVLNEWTPSMVQLHDALMKLGMGRGNRYEFGNDAYVYAVADRELSKPADPVILSMLEGLRTLRDEDKVEITDIKAFVLETQSRQFIVVLNRRFSVWHLHIREIYPSLEETLRETRYLGGLEDFKKRKDLTIHDVVRLSQHAQKFADDTPGNPFPKRLSLKTFLDSELLAGDDAACWGLRYEDARDIGYIASFRGENKPEVKDIAFFGYRDVVYAMFNLRCAADQLVTDPAQ
jgi:hypothetical protein